MTYETYDDYLAYGDDTSAEEDYYEMHRRDDDAMVLGYMIGYKHERYLLQWTDDEIQITRYKKSGSELLKHGSKEYVEVHNAASHELYMEHRIVFDPIYSDE